MTYAGETVTTTDDVAEALVELTAALARQGQADSVRIPIVLADNASVGDAELVIGVGNDVLSVPVEWDADVPDFSEAAARMRTHPALAGPEPVRIEPYDPAVHGPSHPYDPDFDIDRA